MITPSRILSWCVYKLSRVRIRMIKNTLIGWFIHLHKIDLGEYRRENKDDYLTFNEFFTREIKPELRPTEGPIDAVVSAVDGVVFAYGRIDGDTMIQLKNLNYSLKHFVHEKTPLRAECRRKNTLFLKKRSLRVEIIRNKKQSCKSKSQRAEIRRTKHIFPTRKSPVGRNQKKN